MEKCLRCLREFEKANSLTNGLCCICSRKDNILSLIKEKKEDELVNELIGIISKKIIDELNGDFFTAMEHRKDISIAIVVYYLAKRKMNLPTNFDEIAKIFDYDLKERHSRRILHRIFKKIRENIGMKTCKKSTLMGTKCLLQDTPKKYVEDLCNKLGLSETILKKSLNKLKKVEKDMIFMGNHPQAIAGGIVYIICRKEKINITQRKIGDILNITEVSLRNVSLRIKE